VVSFLVFRMPVQLTTDYYFFTLTASGTNISWN